MAGGFDLVVAANVVHATADLTTSLAPVARTAGSGRAAAARRDHPAAALARCRLRRVAGLVVLRRRLPPERARCSSPISGCGCWATPASSMPPSSPTGPRPGHPGSACSSPAARCRSSRRAELEPTGRWAVSGDGPLADAIRGQLAALGVLADRDAGATDRPDRADPCRRRRWSTFLDLVRERTGPLAGGIWVITTGAQAVGTRAPPTRMRPRSGGWSGSPARSTRISPGGWSTSPAEPTDDDIAQLLGLLFTGRRQRDRGRGRDRAAGRTPAGATAAPDPDPRLDPGGAAGRRLAGRRRSGPAPSTRSSRARRRGARPGAGEVEIRIEAASVQLPRRDAGQRAAAGDGLGGNVRRSAARPGSRRHGRRLRRRGSTTSSVGDAVFGIGPGTFASYTTTPAELVTRIPAGLDHESAAASPCAFVTAVYALERIAALQPGERVLIHAGDRRRRAGRAAGRSRARGRGARHRRQRREAGTAARTRGRARLRFALARLRRRRAGRDRRRGGRRRAQLAGRDRRSRPGCAAWRSTAASSRSASATSTPTPRWSCCRFAATCPSARSTSTCSAANARPWPVRCCAWSPSGSPTAPTSRCR